jgi:tetratricopeptide (TPR) repeat protein
MSARAQVLLLLAAISAPPPAPLAAQERPTRPAWVEPGVPDTVWVLAETAAAADTRDETKRILREAEAAARAALDGHEQDPGRHFALAAVLGMRAEVEGGRTKVSIASALYEELDLLLELDPGHARGRYMMGRLHAAVRRMNGVTRWLATKLLGGEVLEGASWDEAVRHLEYAESRAPEVPDHHVQLACVYRDIGRVDLALTELEHALAMEASSPMEQVARARALEVRAEIYAAWSSD